MTKSRLSVNDDRILILGLILEFALIVIAVSVGEWFQADVRSWIIPSVNNALFGIAVTIPLYLVFVWLWFWSPPGMRGDRELLIETLGGPLHQIGILGCLLLAALAGIAEELFFRGTMQTLGMWALGLWPSVVMTNVVFGLVHKVSWSYAVFAFIAGVIFSLIDQAGVVWPGVSGTAEPSRNLLAPMIAHGLYDFLAFLHVRTAWRARGENKSAELV